MLYITNLCMTKDYDQIKLNWIGNDLNDLLLSLTMTLVGFTRTQSTVGMTAVPGIKFD